MNTAGSADPATRQSTQGLGVPEAPSGLGRTVFIGKRTPSPTGGSHRRPAATTARTLSATEVFEDCVSAWDGNHDGLEALIRAQLNDPGSMETHGTYYNPSDSLTDGSITIRLDYGARNALGGMVRTNAYADMGTNCAIIRVLDYGFG